MKLKVLAVSLLAFFVLAGSAQAVNWHLGVPLARHETESFMKSFCEEQSECLAWAGSKCLRISERQVDCRGASWWPGESVEVEEECYLTLYWGTSSTGVIALKNHSSPKCITVEAVE
jgi:hypothetical protein